MKTSATNKSAFRKLFLLLISIVMLTEFSCKKEAPEGPAMNGTATGIQYLIFNSDSLDVVGKIIGDPADRFLYPNKPYEVLNEQRILFFRQGDSANTVFFRVTADVGNYNYFTPVNQYHYHLVNEYILIVK
jgi:hypothetical protein